MLAALSLACGIGVSAWLYRPPALWAAAYLGSLALACVALAKRRHALLAQVSALLAFFAAGGLLLGAHDAARPAAPHFGDLTGGEPAVVTGVIAREGSWRAVEGSRNTRRIVFDMQTEQVEAQGATRALRARIRVTVVDRPGSREEYDDAESSAPAGALPDLLYGDRVRMTTRLRAAHNFGNPGGFDYRAYLHGQGISALAWAKLEQVQVLATGTDTGWMGRRAQARRALLNTIGALWPEPQGSLMAAMLLGERGMLDRQVRTDFQRTGVYHILVVSGMNVGILAMFTLWLLHRMGVREMLATPLAFVLVLGYAVMTDGGAPVVRATLMLALYLFTRMMYRDGSPANAAGLAALLILAWYPRALFEASFQLTFLAVLAITSIAAPLLQQTTGPYRRGLRHLASPSYDMALPPRVAQFRVELRMVLERLARITGMRLARAGAAAVIQAVLAVFDLLLVSAIMQVALVLPMAFYFHRITLLGLAANMVVVPLTTVLIPSALAATTVAAVWPAAAHPLAAIASSALGLILWSVAQIGGARFVDLRLANPQFLPAVFAVAAFVAAMALARRRRWMAVASLAALVMAAAAIVSWPRPSPAPAGVLEVTAIDVGQGDALLVVSPAGKTLLVDAGGLLPFSTSELEIGENVVSPYLWSRGIERLDAVAVTHAHADHIGGMAAIIENFRPRELWVSVDPGAEAFQGLLRTAREHGVNVRALDTRAQFDFGGAAMSVLAPAPDYLPTRSRNDDSLVLQFSYGETSALLIGDVERKLERSIAASAAPAQVLKVSHHGSASSTTPELLRALQPRFALISVGGRNPYGHPKVEVLQRLQEASVKTYRTDSFGAVTFLLDGKTVSPAVRSR